MILRFPRALLDRLGRSAPDELHGLAGRWAKTEELFMVPGL